MNSSNPASSETCPCGSNKSYTKCCGLYISGEESAPTAEALMRSRYSAYTRQDDDYLMKTWHPDTRPSYKPSDDDGTTWTGLHVINTDRGMETDNEGTVEFVAYCKVNDATSHLHEVSQFVREKGTWYYVDGKGQEPIKRHTPKVGRNDPCPCGSGKKYKKCCGR